MKIPADVFPKTLLGIIFLGMVFGLVGVWFPQFFKSDVGPKLIWSFVVIAVGVAVATGVLNYLPLNK
jgi:NhaP-type Na+/H+ or K+/H+ antiporter